MHHAAPAATTPPTNQDSTIGSPKPPRYPLNAGSTASVLSLDTYSRLLASLPADVIDLVDNSTFSSFAELVIQQVGADTVITVGGDTITLQNYDNTVDPLTATNVLV